MRKFLNSPTGQTLTAVVVVVGVCALIWSAKASLGNGESVGFSKDRVYIDSTTGKPYHVDAEPGGGATLPLKSPSGQTGYPAEPCFWNADGTTKTDPTYVLLKAYLGERGPTFCPDCGRLVMPHNPPPSAGTKPPPTEKEYERMKQSMQMQ